MIEIVYNIPKENFVYKWLVTDFARVPVLKLVFRSSKYKTSMMIIQSNQDLSVLTFDG